MDIEDIFDLEIDKKKPRGISFTSENNPQQLRWVCLACGMESNLNGILRHHKHSGHIGKQRLFENQDR